MSGAYWNDLRHHLGDSVESRFWLSDPLVRRRVNQRVSGDPQCWPVDWLREYLAAVSPLPRALSLGCGTGNLERDLCRKRIVQSIVGVDTAPDIVDYARAESGREGFGPEQIDFVVAEAREILRRQRDLDAVFFHGSLHHFDRMEELLSLVEAALRPRGFLIIDEYVGPSMREWGWVSLLLPNLFYRCLPRSVRRVGLIRAPRNPADPSEMICASEIRPAIESRFEVAAVRDYGGNLVSLLYANLRRPGSGPGSPTTEEFNHAIEFLLDGEDRMLRWPGPLRRPSFHTVMVGRTRAKA